MATYIERLVYIKLNDLWISCCCKSRDKLKPLHLDYQNLYGYLRFVGEWLTMRGLSLTNSFDPLVTWSKIKGQTKTIISSVAQYLLQPNLTGKSLIMRSSHPSHIIPRWSDQIKTLSLLPEYLGPCFISTIIILLATKLERSVIYDEKFSPIKLLDPSMT